MFESLSTWERVAITILVVLPIPGDMIWDAAYYYMGVQLW